MRDEVLALECDTDRFYSRKYLLLEERKESARLGRRGGVCGGVNQGFES